VVHQDLLKIRQIIVDSGAKEAAKKEIDRLITKARRLIATSKVFSEYKVLLYSYAQELLTNL